MTTIVDQLGQIKAQIAELEAREKALSERLKRDLLRAGVREVEGGLFRATYSVSERITVDVKRVVTDFPPTKFPDLYRSQVVESIRVVARTGELLAA